MVITATLLMLIIIVPVIAIHAVLFAWKYRQSNTEARRPGWHHSTTLELVIWTVPLMIIIALGAHLIGTHKLDPTAPGPGRRPAPVAAGVKPMEVQVVAMDWKWLFFYPSKALPR